MLNQQAREWDINKFTDERGSLCFLENPDDIPFSVERIFYVFDLDVSAERGGHAHKECQELLVMLSGSARVTLHDGEGDVVFTADRPNKAIYIPARHWITIDQFSDDARFVVLASHRYDVDDYIHDFDDFISFVTCVEKNKGPSRTINQINPEERK